MPALLASGHFSHAIVSNWYELSKPVPAARHVNSPHTLDFDLGRHQPRSVARILRFLSVGVCESTESTESCVKEISMSNSAMTEKRGRYRTSTDLLSITVVDPQGRMIRGRVFDLSAGGIAIFIHRKQDPTYQAGNVVRLDMRSPLLRETVTTQAKIRRIEECESGRLYGFEFLDWGKLLSQLPVELSSLFNRRRQHRLRFDPDQPVAVTVEGLSAGSWDQVFGGVTGVLRDISPRGLCFRVDPEQGRKLRSDQFVEVLFTLRGSTERFAIWAQVCHCVSRSGGVYCGVRFDPERTERFLEKRNRMIAVLTQESTPPSSRSREVALAGVGC